MLHRCTVGLTGAEYFAHGRLTCPLGNATVDAPMLLVAPSFQPVLLSFVTWSSCALSNAPTHCRRSNRSKGIGLTGATCFFDTCPNRRGGHLDTSNISLYFFNVIWRLDGELAYLYRELDTLDYIHGT